LKSVKRKQTFRNSRVLYAQPDCAYGSPIAIFSCTSHSPIIGSRSTTSGVWAVHI